MAESWVINASPTILLAKAGLMSLVPKLVAEFVIPEPVISEILNAGPNDPAAIWFRDHGKPFTRPVVAELPSLAGSGIGFVGVILRLKETGLIAEAKRHLEKVRNVGGYISDDLFRQALRQVGEKL